MTHILRSVTDKRTACGTKRAPGLRRVWLPYAARHVRGHTLELCPQCVTATENTPAGRDLARALAGE